MLWFEWRCVAKTLYLFLIGVWSTSRFFDGFQDLLITGYGRVQLWHNLGDGTFRDTTNASGIDDTWADPRGEFLSLKHASPVYELLGIEGLSADTWPEADRPITGTLGYHVRSGGHDVTDYDWERYLDFADKHLRKY